MEIEQKPFKCDVCKEEHRHRCKYKHLTVCEGCWDKLVSGKVKE